jgi:hypothetical protein
MDCAGIFRTDESSVYHARIISYLFHTSNLEVSKNDYQALTNGIDTFCERDHIMHVSDMQMDFRKGRSTVDTIFILLTFF